jgi:hypothetical protein
MVFALGGHNYFRNSSNNVDLQADRYNGQRMILNALFVPVTRPQSCGQQLGFPNVIGFKSVRVGNGPGEDLGSVGIPNAGDTVVWTIDYINNGNLAAEDFQVTDNINQFASNHTYVSGPTVTVSSNLNGTVAAANGGFNGTGNQDLLAAGAILGVGGRITVEFKTKLTSGNFLARFNQASASYSFGLEAVGGPILTHKIDSGDGQQNFAPVPPFTVAGNLLQDPNPVANPGQPTVVLVPGPTAADGFIEGRVVAGGRGLSGITVSITNGDDGAVRTATTNSFGFFRFDDLDIGNFYILTASNKRYNFNTLAFTLEESVSGLVLTATPKTLGQ